jgi:hypothetical protein
MIKETKLNNVSVKPIVDANPSDVTKIKGYALIPMNYWTLFICSKKKSGKTSLINEITKKCTDKRTVFWIFCSTYKIDASWVEIIKMLEERGNQVNTFDTIQDGKENILDSILDGLSDEPTDKPVKEEKQSGEGITIKKPEFNIFGSGKQEKEKKEYVPKKSASKNLFIFDDISSQLKNPAVARLLKQHRHSGSSVIISSQYLHDIRPESTLQIDYFFAFRSFSEEKLLYIHKVLDLSIDFNKLWELYKYATEKPFNFLYLNVRTEEMRQNFNKKLEFDI